MPLAVNTITLSTKAKAMLSGRNESNKWAANCTFIGNRNTYICCFRTSGSSQLYRKSWKCPILVKAAPESLVCSLPLKPAVLSLLASLVFMMGGRGGGRSITGILEGNCLLERLFHSAWNKATGELPNMTRLLCADIGVQWFAELLCTQTYIRMSHIQMLHCTPVQLRTQSDPRIL